MVKGLFNSIDRGMRLMGDLAYQAAPVHRRYTMYRTPPYELTGSYMGCWVRILMALY